jgi:hypothetical protein
MDAASNEERANSGSGKKWYDSLNLKNLYQTDGELDFNKIAGLAGLGGSALGLFGSSQPTVGYQGSIPQYTAMRSRVPNTFDPDRRPGSGGQRYFSDVQYVPKDDTAASQAAQTALATEVAGLAALNRANPAQQVRPPSVIPDQPTIPTPVSDTGVATLPTIPTSDSYTSPYQSYADGGIAKLQKGRYLDGETDGMADEVPAMIDNEQPAMLSDGEFVIPADVVSHLGNGNSDAGAKVLEDMMDRVRKARTGTTKQGPEIDPKEFLPA